MRGSLLIALSLGITGFIIALLFYRFAPFVPLLAASILALVLIVVSLWLLWSKPATTEELSDLHNDLASDP